MLRLKDISGRTPTMEDLHNQCFSAPLKRLGGLAAFGVDLLQAVEFGAELLDSVVAEFHIGRGLADFRVQGEYQFNGRPKCAVWIFGNEALPYRLRALPVCDGFP